MGNYTRYTPNLFSVLKRKGEKYAQGINKKGKILGFTIDSGYCRVTLRINEKSKRFCIHRLMAMAFIPNPDSLEQVNHINGIKTDNRICNLEWVSRSQNLIHAYRVLGSYHHSKAGRSNK